MSEPQTLPCTLSTLPRNFTVVFHSYYALSQVICIVHTLWFLSTTFVACLAVSHNIRGISIKHSEYQIWFNEQITRKRRKRFVPLSNIENCKSRVWYSQLEKFFWSRIDLCCCAACRGTRVLANLLLLDLWKWLPRDFRCVNYNTHNTSCVSLTDGILANCWA